MPVSNQLTVTPAPAPAPKRARPRKALNAQQLYKRVLKPLARLQGSIKTVTHDPALPEVLRQIDAMESVLWKLYNQRRLAEAQAQDKGEICWEVFHPRCVGAPPSIFAVQRKVTRTPNTISIRGEYVNRSSTFWEQRWGHLTLLDSGPRVVDADAVLGDLDRELHRDPFDPIKFVSHGAMVDGSYRRYLAKGGPEQEAA